MNRPRILIATEALDLGVDLALMLREERMDVAVVHRIVHMRRFLAQEYFDLILLDTAMPNADEAVPANLIVRKTCTCTILLDRSTKTAARSISPIMCTDLQQLPDQRQYRVDSVPLKSLPSLIRSTLRDMPLMSKQWKLEIRARQLTAPNGQRVPLTPKELQLLALLQRLPEQIASRQQIGEQLWGETNSLDSRRLEVMIFRLRQKLQRAFGTNQQLLTTVRGIGYGFTLPLGVWENETN